MISEINDDIEKFFNQAEKKSCIKRTNFQKKSTRD
jgi:hypothetical protein